MKSSMSGYKSELINAEPTRLEKRNPAEQSQLTNTKGTLGIHSNRLWK